MTVCKKILVMEFIRLNGSYITSIERCKFYKVPFIACERNYHFKIILGWFLHFNVFTRYGILEYS